MNFSIYSLSISIVYFIIEMEKIKHNSLTSWKISNRQQIQNLSQKQAQINTKPLGGVYLYNEHCKRYIQNREDLQVRKQEIMKQQSNNNSILHSNQFDKHYFEQLRRNQVISDHQAEIHKHHNIADQLEKIIGELRRSQVNTINFIQEIKKGSNLEEYNRFCSFQQIFQLYTKKNVSKFSTIMQKIQQQLRRRYSLLLQKVKPEQLQKIKNKSVKIVIDQSVQTHVDYHTQNLEDIHKQLEKSLDLKKIEYEALFHHNTQTLIDFNQSSLQFQQNIVKQKVFIKNLELKIEEKFIQTKKLQNQLKNAQDCILRKLIKRKSYKSELESIEEIQPEDAIEQNRISVALKKKFRKKIQKRRAESVILNKSQINNKFTELISQIADIEKFKSMSMKEINYFNSHKESQNQTGVRVSIFEKKIQKRQPSKLKRNDRKQTQRFKNKSDFSKAINHLSNENLKHKNIDFYQMKQARRSQSKIYVEMERLQQKRQSKLEHKRHTQNNFKNRLTAKRSTRPSLENNFLFKTNNTIKDFQPQKNSLETKDQSINTDFVALNSGKIPEKDFKNTQVSIYDSKMSQKIYKTQKTQKSAKISKEVSFHLKNDKAFDLNLCSQQISICIENKISKNLTQTRNDQVSEYEVYSQKKQKSEVKTRKSKLTKKTHFKAHLELSLFHKQLKKKKESFVQQIQEQTNFSQKSKQNIYLPSQQDKQSQYSTSKNNQNHAEKSSTKNAFYNSKYFENKFKSLATKCIHKDQFLREFSKLHNGCAQNCEHLKKYLQLFQKLRNKSLRSAFKMKVQYLNSHIKQNQFPSKISPFP